MPSPTGMTLEPVVSRAIAATWSPEIPAALTALRLASASPRMWSSCDWVAKSGSSRLRWRGYSETAEPITPFSLSTIETRTLSVPKSTPATMAMLVSPQQNRCQRTDVSPTADRLRLPSSVI